MRCILKPTGETRVIAAGPWIGRIERELTCEACEQKSLWSFHEIKSTHRDCVVVGLGDRIAAFLTTLGFNKKQGCGCGKRQEAMNTWGWRLSQFWHREKRPFTYCILGTTALAWTVKFLFGM